jgi:hypothetical protein
LRHPARSAAAYSAGFSAATPKAWAKSSLDAGSTRATKRRGEAKFLRLPVVSLAAEHLVMGHLMRRNVLT